VTDLSDFQLLKTPSVEEAPGPVEEPPRPVEEPPRRRAVGLPIAIALLVAASAVATYIVFSRLSPRSEPAAVTSQTNDGTTVRVDPVAPVVLPPLDQTDAVVRKLMEAITANPQVAAWLATDHLVRNFTAGVTDVAGGATPTRLLPMWRLSSSFRSVPRGKDLIIDPRSYERYDTLAAAAASLDPQASARVYKTLKPRIDEASRDLGDASFDRTLERAIVLLLGTPDVSDPIRLRPKGTGYALADPALESLAPAQKLLLRTGPRNVQRFKDSLRAFALAIGIPDSRLPARSQTQ
jgi:DUF3014 family protein